VSSSGAAAGFGLLSATSWGGSDFVGGLGSRRGPALLVVASGHLFTLIGLVAVCLGMRIAAPGWGPFAYSAIGGFEGALALALFYQALAKGAMGLTAALCGLITALIPVLFSMIHDGLPTPLVAAGLVLGLGAIWLITRTPSPDEGLTGESAAGAEAGEGAGWAASRGARARLPLPARLALRAPLAMGALAGVGFGCQLVLLKLAGTGSIFWIMADARAAGVAGLMAVLLVVYRKGLPKGRASGFLGFGILAGLLDTVGNLFYILASRHGRLDVAAMVCSLYPGGTILLAMLILGERPSRRQMAGIGLALGAVVLLTV
jgi:drug/metabolite transporter (DMT)-like permease